MRLRRFRLYTVWYFFVNLDQLYNIRNKLQKKKFNISKMLSLIVSNQSSIVNVLIFKEKRQHIYNLKEWKTNNQLSTEEKRINPGIKKIRIMRSLLSRVYNIHSTRAAPHLSTEDYSAGFAVWIKVRLVDSYRSVSKIVFLISE